ncbi:MAG: insulinase family protein [Deltaproteobacteria bacterium]|nr:insulinase family protein [Deltaproteobacteria bacterium]
MSTAVKNAFLFWLLATVYCLLSFTPSWAKGPIRTQLDNVQTVILEEDHSAPVVALPLWVRGGSADEDNKEAGISHVFEHMLFKGTKKRGVGQIASEVEASGGYINAFTSYDQTVYHLALASRYFDTGLDIISDAIQNSSFDPLELSRETDVVLEELKMGEDEPGRKLYKSILETAYTTHPYKRPVIGFQDRVKGLTRKQILQFFKKWYIPNNMTLVVVGDFDPQKALLAIKDTFRDFRSAHQPHKPRPEEPSQKGLKTQILTEDIKETHMGLAYHIPSLSHPDIYAIDVLSVILGQGESSRLYQRLKAKEPLVHTISSYAMTPKEPGVFLVTSTLEGKDIKMAMEEILREIYRMRHEGVTQAEMEKAKLNLESEFIYQRETMEGRARQLGYFETVAGDIAFEKRYLEGIKGVTSDDIKKVVKTYLDDENLTIGLILPRTDKGVIDAKGIEGITVAIEEEARGRYTKPLEKKDVTKVILDNGMTLLVKEDRSNPTVAIYMAFLGGLRFEDETTNGITNFIAKMLTKGTRKRTALELAEEVESMAGGLEGFSGRNSFGVSAKFLSRYFDKGLEIVADCIVNPTFPVDEMEKTRKEILADIKRQEDYLPQFTFNLLNKTLYEKHPYRMTVVGTEENVTRFKKDDIIAQYERQAVPGRMVVSIVGDVNTRDVVEKVKEMFKGFTRLIPPLPVIPVEERQKAIKKATASKEKRQAHIALGFLGTTITDKDRYPLSVLSAILSNQGGRLYLELRDKEALAYVVMASSREGLDPGAFVVYMGTSPDKVEQAIDGILRELKKIVTGKITDEELKRAKGLLVGNYEMGLQENSSRASDMAFNELYGLGYDEYKRYASKIEAVTLDDVLMVAQKYINLDGYTLAIVRPR